MSQPKRFRCPACKKVLDRPQVHGNRQSIKDALCLATGLNVTLRRLKYRKG
jgi:hypothetical protein